jgi:chromosome segregation ATPase
MSQPLLMERDDPQARKISELEIELRQVRRELSDAELRAERATEDAGRALGMLRKQLGPLYRALQAVFGELDAAGIHETREGGPAPAESSDRVSAVWTAWKSKLSPACGRVIDALLTHGELTGQQICVAAHMGKNTMRDVITKLNRAGVLAKNGGRYSLKQL